MLVKHACARNVAGLTFLWVITGFAHAEISYKIPTGFGWRLGLPLHLMEAEAVQKDLELSAEKAYRLSQWRASVVEAAKSDSAGVKDKIKLREILQRVQAGFQPAVDLILTLEQQNRLHEIDLQLEGFEALSDPRVAEALELSTDQQFNIRSIHNRLLKEEIASVKGGRKADHLTIKDRDKLLLNVLNPAQRDNFSRMKGSAFDRSGFLQILRFRNQELEVWNVAYSPDGKRLASSRQNEIFIWEADSGKLLSQMHGHAANITSMCFGPDGKWLISASADRTVRSWDVESGNNILSHGETHSAFDGRFIPGLGAECFRSIALSPDGKLLAHANGTSISTSYNISPLVPPFIGSGQIFFGIPDRLPVWSVAYNSDGKRQACGRIDGSVYLLGFGVPKKIVAATDAVLCVAYSADGQQLATASADGSVKMWNSADGEAIASLQSHEKAARCVTFNHDSSLIASAGEDGLVRITSPKNPASPVKILTHKGKATAVSFNADGKRIASTGSDGLVRVWSVNGDEIFVLDPQK